MTVPNIHPSSAIGPRVIVASSAHIGPNCYIDGCTKIGANTTLVGGITLVGNAEIGDDCLLEPGVSMTGTLAAAADPDAPVIVGSGTRVGAGSVLARGVNIGSNVKIDVGAFVSRNVPSHAIVSGNPARIVGYDASGSTGGLPEGEERRNPDLDLDAAGARFTLVEGVRFYEFPVISDARGDLSVGEFRSGFPFEPKRYFVVYNVPSAAHRGEHAHRSCEEILICLRGSVIVVVDDGTRREEIELDDPRIGLYLAPLVWRVQYRYSSECMMLVLASSHYDLADYITDYDRFLVERRSGA